MIKLRVPRWVFVLAAGALLAVAMFTTVIATRPYKHPVIAQEPGGEPASFDGIKQLIADAQRQGTTLHLLWTHGACTDGSSWAADRATRIAAALDGAATETTVEDIAGLKRVLYEIHTPGGDFDATFVIWSGLTEPFKRNLDFDVPGSDRATSHPYRRAALNSAVKTKLINNCLADLVVYSGQHGDPIRAGMKLVLCRTFGGKLLADEFCEFSGADLDRPLAVVAESLGSKMLFDAARSIYEEARPVAGARTAIAHRFASVQMIYLMSTQIPLLDIASPLRPLEADMEEEAASNASCLSQMIEMMHRARTTLPSEHVLIDPTIVVFTDPNDLLSYRLIPSALDLSHARLINVIGSNDTTWLGYIERPDTAHCGYKWNQTVIGLIALGYKVGEPVPRAQIIGPNTCPW